MSLTETAQLLGNFGEFVGTIAVVITLAFVGLELRANRRQNRLSLLNTLDDGWNVINAQIAQDESVASLFNRGGPDPDFPSQMNRRS
jgi:hypothetical protein